MLTFYPWVFRIAGDAPTSYCRTAQYVCSMFLILPQNRWAFVMIMAKLKKTSIITLHFKTLLTTIIWLYQTHKEVSVKTWHFPQDTCLILYFLKISLMYPTQRFSSIGLLYHLFLNHLTKIFHNISFKVNYFQWIIIFYIW